MQALPLETNRNRSSSAKVSRAFSRRHRKRTDVKESGDTVRKLWDEEDFEPEDLRTFGRPASRRRARGPTGEGRKWKVEGPGEQEAPHRRTDGHFKEVIQRGVPASGTGRNSGQATRVRKFIRAVADSWLRPANRMGKSNVECTSCLRKTRPTRPRVGVD